MKQGICHNCGVIKHLNRADICIDCQIEMDNEARDETRDKEMENRISQEIAEKRDV